MSECNCITQKISITRYKKVLNWKDKFPMFGMNGYLGYQELTIHANSVKELQDKKTEIKLEFQNTYPEQEIIVRTTY